MLREKERCTYKGEWDGEKDREQDESERAVVVHNTTEIIIEKRERESDTTRERE